MTATLRTPRRQLSAAERVERNARIAMARATGEPWAPIAEREGVTERTAIRAWQEHLRSQEESAVAVVPRLSDVDAGSVVAEVIAANRAALRAALALVENAKGENAKVGALRTVAQVGSALHTVLIRSGLIGDAGLMRYQAELELVARAVFALADRHGISMDEVDATLHEIPMRGLVWGEVT